MTNLAVLQAEIGNTTHRRSFALGKILVDLVDMLGDVVVGLVEELTSAQRALDQ